MHMIMKEDDFIPFWGSRFDIIVKFYDLDCNIAIFSWQYFTLIDKENRFCNALIDLADGNIGATANGL